MKGNRSAAVQARFSPFYLDQAIESKPASPVADATGGLGRQVWGKKEVKQKMQEQIKKQSVPAGQAIFLQGGSPEANVKRCGYCDRLVRWTSVEGRNVAVNSDGSRHQCLTDGTAKRKEPVRHARPSPDEVSGFLGSGKEEVPPQQEQPENSVLERTRDAEIKAMHKANVSAWKAQTEATTKLAEAMTKVAKSNNALVESNRRLAKTYGRLAHAMERAGYILR